MYNLSIQERLDIIEHKLKFVPDEDKPLVVFIQSLFPMVIKRDVRIGNLCHTAGDSFRNNYVENSSGELIPDVILISADRPIEETLREVVPFFSAKRWRQTPAIRNNRIYLLDDVSKFGSRNEDEYVVAREILAEILYPQYFTFGYEGRGWVKFEWESDG